VAAAWFFTDDHQHDRAVAVRRDLRDSPRSYVVPHLFYSELIHVLSRKWREVATVRSAVDVVIRFGIRTLALSNNAWLRSSDWACTRVGGYDATFVALAEDIGGKWLTADEEAASAVGDVAIVLAEWS
jgi:predicted nucleic acid-binding protein